MAASNSFGVVPSWMARVFVCTEACRAAGVMLYPEAFMSSVSIFCVDGEGLLALRGLGALSLLLLNEDVGPKAYSLRWFPESSSVDGDSAGLCRPRRVYVVSAGLVDCRAKRNVCEANLKLGPLV